MSETPPSAPLSASIRIHLSEVVRGLLVGGLSTGTFFAWLIGAAAFRAEGAGAAALLLAVLISLTVYALVQRITQWGQGEATVEDDHLVIRAGRRERRFPLRRLAWGGRRRGGVDFETAAGHRIVLDTQDLERAHALLSATGRGVDQRRLQMALRGEVGPFTSGLVFFVFLLFPLSMLSGALLPVAWLTHVLVVLTLALLGAWFLVRTLRSPYVAVGMDGVTIKRGWRKRFIPHDRIEQVRTPGTNLVLHFDGKVVNLPTVGWSRSDVERVVHRIEDARRKSQGGGASPEDFARQGLDAASWVEQLERAMSADAGFRRRRVTVDDATRTLADPLAPLETRVGAALAMRRVAPDVAPKRIRFAAESAADQATREVLLATLEAEAEEAVARLDRR